MKKTLLLCSAALLLTVLGGCGTASDRSQANPRFSRLPGVVEPAGPGAAPHAQAGSHFSTLPGGADTNFTQFSVGDPLSPELRQPAAKPFTLGPGDRLEIEVLGRPTSRTETFVGPDGKIYYSLLPGLEVWGLTLAQTRQLLEKKLGKYLADPQVAVSLREVGSRSVWLLGRLAKPGVYPLAAPMSLLEAIALAGGTARSASAVSSEDLADLRHSFVLRQGRFLQVDFYRLLREGDTTQNIFLQPDDLVYIPSALAQEVYVLGAVRFPHAIPYTEPMTLVSAIAGGAGAVRYDLLTRYETGVFLKDARLSHVAIVRGSLTQPRIAVVDFNAILKGKAQDVVLEPGDIVYVPNSPFVYLKSYLNMIVNTFVSTVAANEGINAGGGEVGIGVSVPVNGR